MTYIEEIEGMVDTVDTIDTTHNVTEGGEEVYMEEVGQDEEVTAQPQHPKHPGLVALERIDSELQTLVQRIDAFRHRYSRVLVKAAAEKWRHQPTDEIKKKLQRLAYDVGCTGLELERLVLKLDGVDTDGDPNLRTARKDEVKKILGSIEVCDSIRKRAIKAEQNRALFKRTPESAPEPAPTSTTTSIPASMTSPTLMEPEDQHSDDDDVEVEELSDVSDEEYSDDNDDSDDDVDAKDIEESEPSYAREQRRLPQQQQLPRSYPRQVHRHPFFYERTVPTPEIKRRYDAEVDTPPRRYAHGHVQKKQHPMDFGGFGFGGHQSDPFSAFFDQSCGFGSTPVKPKSTMGRSTRRRPLSARETGSDYFFHPRAQQPRYVHPLFF
jgi:hypothetical protein